MYATGIGNQPTIVNNTNSRVVTNPDPDNPVISSGDSLSDSDSFMTLMIEQLRHQDPMDPMDSNALTSQLAQLNSLEQLVTISSLLQQNAQTGKLADANSLIGRWVEGLDAENNIITGYVDRVELIDGEPTLKVGDMLLLLDQILAVDDNEYEAGDA